MLHCVAGPEESAPLDTDALVLHMGQYYLPSLAAVIPAAAGEPAGGPELSPAALGIEDAAVAAAAGAVIRGGTPDFQLQLYSVLPRKLQSFAKVWKNRLTFREGTQQTCYGYFDAPGAWQ